MNGMLYLFRKTFSQVVIAVLLSAIMSFLLVPELLVQNKKLAAITAVGIVFVLTLTKLIRQGVFSSLTFKDSVMYFLIASSFIGPAIVLNIGPIGLFPFRVFYLLIIGISTIIYIRNKSFFDWGLIRTKPIFVFLIFWFLYACLSLTWAPSITYGIRNLFYLFTGLSLIVLVTFYFKEMKNYLAFFYIWIVVYIGLIGLGLWNHFTEQHLSLSRINDLPYYMQGVPTAVFGNENDYASYLVISMFFVWFFMKHRRPFLIKLIGFTLIVITIYLIYLTNSRANYISILIGFGGWFILYSEKTTRRILVFSGVLSAIAVSFLFYNKVMTLLTNFISTNFQRNEGGSLDIRANILKNVQYYFAESMGFGVGAGNADYFLKNEPVFPIGVFSNVHNWWGEILVNYGAIIFGGYLAMYLSLLILLYRISKRTMDKNEKMIAQTLTISLFVFAMASISPSSVLTLNYHWMLFAFSIGFITYYFRNTKVTQQTINEPPRGAGGNKEMLKKYSKTISERFKKYFWLFLLLPILTAGISYVLEYSSPVSHSAKSEIALGNFEYDRITEPVTVKDFLTNVAYLRQLDEEYGFSMPVEDIADNLVVGEEPGKLLTLRLDGNDEKLVSDTLSDLTEAFITESDKVKEERTAFFNEKIKRLQELPDNPESMVDKEQFIYELELNLMNMRDTVINKPVTVSTAAGDPLQRTIFGLLIGIALSVTLLLIPEFLRKD